MSNLLRLVACLSLCVSFNSFGAQTFQINNVKVNQLFNTTFDGLVFSKAVVDDGTFFGSIPDINNPIFGLNRATAWEHVGGFSGAGTITFNQNIPQSFSVVLPDTNITFITLSFNTMQVETSGASFSAVSIPNNGGYDSNFDAGGPLSLSSSSIIVDWTELNDLTSGETGIVTSCQSPDGFCSLIHFLSLDMVRFTIEGTPSQNGGDEFILRGQTSNNSYIELELSTAAVPLPAGIYLFLSGLVGLGLMRGRRSK